LNPDQRELLELLGFVFLQNARPEKAEAVFAALVALEPRNARHALRLALAQVRAGKHEAALARLDRLLESGDISAAVHLLRGQALARLARGPEAERALRAYVAARAAEPAASGEGVAP
jgi:predicted Zn-dependent protease